MNESGGGANAAASEEVDSCFAAEPLPRDVYLMREALRLAERGWGRVAPNPLVGAVVSLEGQVVGEGYHAEFGEEHAEVAALRKAGSQAAGASLYVTLEPCDHWGKTPPCASAILEAGVRRVVFACEDPDSPAAGGAQRLREAGLEVVVGVEAEAALRLNAPYFWGCTEAASRSSFVALKLALSLDARLSAKRASRSSVTGKPALEMVHRLRAGFDAVLVGRGTVQADDPQLTVRGCTRPRRPPVRIVLDSDLRTSPETRLAGSVSEGPVWAVARQGVATDRKVALEAIGVRVLEVPAAPQRGVEWRAVLERLAAEGIGSLLVEGGGRIAASLLRERHAHRLYLIYAPILYGSEGSDAFPDAEPTDRGYWEVAETRGLGADTLLILDRASLLGELSGS